MLSMHAPDGYLSHGAALATAAISVAVLLVAIDQTRRRRGHSALATGAVAAIVFAGQMVNFPIADGTTGHLIGAAMAAIILGPWLATVAMTSVVVVQALVVADGGLTALGYNVLNMAIVPTFAGWAIFQLVRRRLPSTTAGVAGATAVASAASVVAAAAAFSLEWMVGGTTEASFGAVLTSMLGVHALIGIGEAAIGAFVVAVAVAGAPSAVRGATELSGGDATVARGRLVVGGLAAATAVATIGSHFAATAPDGLEWVADRRGFAVEATAHRLSDSPFADYAVRSLDSAAGVSIAGLVGVVLTLVVATALSATKRTAT